MEDRLKAYYDMAYTRKSVRHYIDKEVEAEKLDRILEMAHRAPSAANCQPWHFIVIKKEGNESFFEQVLTKPELRSAPLIIAVCVDPDKAWVRQGDDANYAWVDAAIATTEMITAATAEGLGTCWVASFNLETARQMLNIPKKMDLVTLLTLGYSSTPQVPVEKNRKPLHEIIHHNKW